ncbi:MAG: type II toxin-antitoxin system RelE family toxin [bacterium]
MYWTIDWSNAFKKQYKKKNEFIRNKTDEILKKLAESVDPLSLGEKKKNLDFYAIDITYSDRIAYSINSESKTIRLVKVCSHKTVYGKD